jgi:hypothetical protein
MTNQGVNFHLPSGVSFRLPLTRALAPVCADAVEHARAIGPPPSNRPLPYGQLAMDGLVGWCALVARARQRAQPGRTIGLGALARSGRAQQQLGVALG